LSLKIEIKEVDKARKSYVFVCLKNKEEK